MYSWLQFLKCDIFIADDARLIYQTCAFETAWHPKNPSPWCAVFTKEDLEVSLIFKKLPLKVYYFNGMYPN